MLSALRATTYRQLSTLRLVRLLQTDTMTRSFLLCGISWDEFDTLFPDPVKRQEMRSMIEGGLKRTEEIFAAAKVDYKFFNYSPKEDMSRWQAILAEKKWDAVAMYVLFFLFKRTMRSRSSVVAAASA